MKAALILNPRAGTMTGTITPPVIVEAVRATGVELVAAPYVATPPGESVAAAVAQRPDAILVGGGDGTLSSAAPAIVRAGLAMGVIPLGTLNHFARDLRLPHDWREAVRALSSARVRPVDVGEVNGHGFINNCSIGWYAEAVRRRDALRREDGRTRWSAMLLATLSVWRELRPFRYHIETPDTAFAARTPLVVVANNRYAGHVMDACLRPRLDEGRLWLYTTRAHRIAGLTRIAWQALTRGLDRADALDSRPATELEVTCDRAAVPIAADGEVIPLQPPFRFRIVPRALRVLVPGGSSR